MKELLFLLIPESALPLLIVLIGIALMLGMLSRATAFNILGLIILFALLMPFIDSIFDILPLWALLLIMIVFILSIIRGVLSIFFGKGATDQFIGMIMFALYILPFRIICSIFRVMRRGNR